jgi:diguanylate cyclase (GGDEF)-like protein
VSLERPPFRGGFPVTEVLLARAAHSHYMASPSLEFPVPDTLGPPVLRRWARDWGRVEHVAALGVMAAVYFGAAWFGLHLAVVNASATAVWPAAGIALALVLTLGYRMWPAIFVGAFAANLLTTGAVGVSLGIASGNTLEALTGAFLLRQFAGGRRVFDRAPDIVRFFVLAVIGSTMVSATIGVTALVLGGLARWSEFATLWITWWLGDAGGDIVVAPVLLLWVANPRLRWTRFQLGEALLLLTGLSLAALLVFGGVANPPIARYPLEFICTPFLVWAAYRFGQREAAVALVVLAGIATWGTLRGFGPFWRDTPNESLLLLQAFNGVGALMSLVLAAVVREREQVEDQLRRFAVTDALTGLANYRHLMDVLDTEIQRSHRTGRSFAILFLDLDYLKRINDRHGHVVGSHALVRVAHALKATSRTIDTAARFGGDEFALVLPESDDAAVRHVAARIATELANDGQSPVISCSIGIAVYPRDGGSAEALLASADALLYRMKSSTRSFKTPRSSEVSGPVGPAPRRAHWSGVAFPHVRDEPTRLEDA